MAPYLIVQKLHFQTPREKNGFPKKFQTLLRCLCSWNTKNEFSWSPKKFPRVPEMQFLHIQSVAPHPFFLGSCELDHTKKLRPRQNPWSEKMRKKCDFLGARSARIPVKGAGLERPAGTVTVPCTHNGEVMGDKPCYTHNRTHMLTLLSMGFQLPEY